MRSISARSAFQAVTTVLAVASAAGPTSASAQANHEILLEPGNVHWGYYDASIAPVLTIRSGDRVYLETLLARGLGRLALAGADPARFPPAMVAVEEAVTERGPGAHPMTGPIFVEGAAPGDVLEIRILDIDLMMPFGVSGFLPGGGTIPDDFPYAGLQLFELDAEAGVAHMGPDITIPLAPFFGSLGVAPPVLRGRVSSGPPGYHVGNLDNKELVAGTTLFVPVHVDGALLSIGDGHAAQGDGEVSGTAIETSMSGTFEIVLHKDRTLTWPRAETPTHYMSMGLHPDLDEAARIATREMVAFLVAETGITREEAYILCSVALDLRVTQLVDGTKGIHGLLSKDLVRNTSGPGSP